MPEAPADPAGPQEDSMPPMNGDPMGGDPSGMPEAPDDMGNPMGDEPSDDEGDAKKKEIQKATGELSQLLNDYSDPDEELDKYVKGMIDSALENRKENSDAEEESMEETPEADGMENGMGSEPEGGTPQMESVIFTKKQLKKINEGLNPVDDEEYGNASKIRTDKVRKKRAGKTPFDAPKFK